jgi:hypothetical protein
MSFNIPLREFIYLSLTFLPKSQYLVLTYHFYNHFLREFKYLSLTFLPKGQYLVLIYHFYNHFLREFIYLSLTFLPKGQYVVLIIFRILRTLFSNMLLEQSTTTASFKVIPVVPMFTLYSIISKPNLHGISFCAQSRQVFCLYRLNQQRFPTVGLYLFIEQFYT